MNDASAFELLRSPWRGAFAELVGSARENLLICSPFVSVKGVEALVSALRRPPPRVLSTTSLTARNIVSGATAPGALLALCERCESARVAGVGGLHAKIYVANDRAAVVTSANLTEGGLAHNEERGVLVREEGAVRALREDVTGLHRAGEHYGIERLAWLCEHVRRVTEDARRALTDAEEALADVLAQGRRETVNAVLSDTLIYLLRRHGPLTTRELHPMIKVLHPDICDDGVDRVIRGRHYGKKWKHAVRSAQRSLKRAGRIRLENGRWRLAEGV